MGLNGSSKLAMILSSCSTEFGVEVFLVYVSRKIEIPWNNFKQASSLKGFQFRSFSSNVRATGPMLSTYRNVSTDPPHEPPPEGLSRKTMSDFSSSRSPAPSSGQEIG
ncbi:hypothetical protein LB504_012711 [Fusarium proliferatum]|nr:hypothetical protein LB504_012711 [Fusarium proliferatum]